jgi:hypothetical protein
MSGAITSVSGLYLTVTVGETYTDPLVCSVFYAVAGHIQNVDVRNTLQGILGLGNPSALPPVTVESKDDPQSSDKAYTISNNLLQVYIPFSSDSPTPSAIGDVLDSAICLAIAAWSNPMSDQLRASVMAAARLGLQTIAQHLAQDAAQFGK